MNLSKRNQVSAGNKASFRLNSLVLHRVVPNIPENFEDISQRTLQCLLAIPDIRFLSVDSALAYVGEGDVVCLTFDDGYSSDWDFVFPMLLEVGAKATFFVVTDWIGKPGFLSGHQIRKLRDGGMQIGSHSCSHPNFLKIDQISLKRELINSRLRLEDLLGEPITTFAFPFGIENASTTSDVFSCGYMRCCTSKHGIFRSSSEVIPRNSINKYTKINELSGIARPSIATQCRWWAEDLSKSMIKKYASSLYPKLRSIMLEK